MKEKEEIESKEKPKEIITYIQCLNSRKKVIFPNNYSEFKEKICNILQINEESLSQLNICYYDLDNDEVIIESESDFDILSESIFDKEITVINIKISKKGNIDLNRCCENLEKYQDENEEINYLNTSQKYEIKEENNQNEIILNNKFEEKNENNNIDNNLCYSSDNENDYENLIINNNQIKLKNDYMNVTNENQPGYANLINNNINNNNIDINNANNIINKNITTIFMTFPSTCSVCNLYPLVKVMYYCPKCSMILCEKCEEKPEFNHRHLIYKIQTKEQFEDLQLKLNPNKNNNNSNNDANQSQLQKFKNSIINLFGNNNDKNINNQNQDNPQHMSVIQIARQRYDLKGINDNQLQMAINKANGNIDEAILLLLK